ncbi:DeoR/GlpR transcriptional regulator [Siculibacillus lacustris]|uniref:DeoR/GlpR transcriptional regulator n=1 Tax=Siculibacillus lacustris TaxID=1549641 RepID=A0A4Q9VXF3_9HYPH|nr:DeoR/GlpR family DNA-binding transcription regulator [Siculibacillus lacustris]TBW41162.1 DeoR/GlpR transcriptional regulator [Siculibacillus lacustris]
MNRTERRRRRLLELITAGEEDVDVLAAAVEVSASTIRRDLAALAEDGRITRTYGGAVPARPLAEHPLTTREALHRAAKAEIAERALDLVEDGDSLLLDAGSTVAAFGRLLVGRRVRVVTGNMALVAPLIQAGIEVTVLGGVVRPLSMGVVGPLAEAVLRRLTVDKAFLGADGVVAGRGLCEARPEQSALKELMMAQAARVVVLADASKLGMAGQPCWAPLPGAWTLVTDAQATDEQIRPFLRTAGVAVLRGPRST